VAQNKHRAGVEILAGSDMNADLLITGFSLQDELVLLVKAGLTPMEALQAATRNPARFLGLLDALGTIERGKIAELVLLDANPLLDIRHMQKNQRGGRQRPLAGQNGFG
jgi:imidazolonepropionase-like amidohydrolase